MATVIDSLIITLGLDTKAFSKGQKQTSVDLQQTRKETESVAKDIARQGQVASEFFVKLRNNALGLFAIFTAGRGIKDFIRDITQGDAQLGYFSRNINMTSQQLQAWQFAARQSGGSAEEMTAALTSMSNAQQDYALTGQSSVIPYLNALHVSWADNGKARDGSKIFLDLADRFSKMDPARAQAFGRGLNLPPGVVQTLMKGRMEIERLARLQKELGGIQPGDDKRAQQLNNALERLRTRLEGVFRTVLRILGPQLLTLMGRIEKWTLSPEFERTLEKIRIKLESIPWEQIWTDLKTFATNVDYVVQKLGGWVTVTETLFALWAVNKVAGLIRNIAAVGAAILGVVMPKIPIGPKVPGAGGSLASGGRLLLAEAFTGATAMAGLFAAGVDPRHLLPETMRRQFGTGEPIRGMEPPNFSEMPRQFWNWFQNSIKPNQAEAQTETQRQDRDTANEPRSQTLNDRRSDLSDFNTSRPPHLLEDLENWQQHLLRVNPQRVQVKPNELQSILDALGLDKPLERAGKWVNQTVNTGAQSMAQSGGKFNQSIMDWIKRQFTFQHYTSPVQQQEERMATIRRFLDETEHKQGNTGLGMRDDAKERIMRDFLERHHTEYSPYQPSAYTPSQSTANGLGGPRTAPVDLRNEQPRKFDQNANIRAQLIHDEFLKLGYNDAQSWGWASNAMHESGGNPASRPGDGGRSHGLLQWNSDRLARYQQMFGHNPEQGNLQENIQFANWEAHHTEAGNMSAFLAATDPATAAAALSRDFIRPRDREREMAARAATARRLAGLPRQTLGLGQQQRDMMTGLPQAGAGSGLYINPNTTRNNNVSSEMNISNINIHTQATDAPGIARSIGDNLRKHSAVMQFDYGLA